MWIHRTGFLSYEYDGPGVFGPGPRNPTTVSEVALTLILMDTYITLMIYIGHRHSMSLSLTRSESIEMTIIICPPNTISFMHTITSTSRRLQRESERHLYLQGHRENDRFFTPSGVR